MQDYCMGFSPLVLLSCYWTLRGFLMLKQSIPGGPGPWPRLVLFNSHSTSLPASSHQPMLLAHLSNGWISCPWGLFVAPGYQSMLTNPKSKRASVDSGSLRAQFQTDYQCPRFSAHASTRSSKKSRSKLPMEITIWPT